MNEPTALPSKIFNVIELVDYTLDFQILQNLDSGWSYCLQFFPSKENNDHTNDNEYIPDLGHINRIKDADAALIYGRDNYTHWEYAAEAAIDVIETLGFKVNDEVHMFDIIFLDANTQERVVKKGMSDGLDFRLVQ